MQGRSHLVVGATKRYGLTAREAFDECGRHIGCDSDEAEAACQQLLPSAHRVWPPAVRCACTMHAGFENCKCCDAALYL